jgi:Bacterial type II and III secretion system protein
VKSRGASAHRWPALLCAGLWLCTNVRADTLEAITLRHRNAEDLIPVLQPLLPAEAVVTGSGNVLLVRADAATLAQIRVALANLDRAPRQLLITVGQGSDLSRGSTSVRGSGTIGSGDVQVGVNRPPDSTTGAQVIVRSGTTGDQIHHVSSVRALEGYEAYIAIGQTRPFTSTTTVYGAAHGSITTQATDAREVHSGFYATPRLSGDRVTLEISPTQQRVTTVPNAQTVATQTVTTTVAGRLGEWIAIGGSAGSRDGTSTGLVTWGTRSDRTQYSAWVKVDEIAD